MGKKARQVKKQPSVEDDEDEDEDEKEEVNEVTAVRKQFLSKQNQKLKCDICKRNFANESILMYHQIHCQQPPAFNKEDFLLVPELMHSVGSPRNTSAKKQLAATP